MKYRATCPKCGTRQSRWEFSQPVPGFVNTCKKCGTSYRLSKYSSLASLAMGILVAMLYVATDIKIISWQYALAACCSLILIYHYAIPYFTKLIEIDKHRDNALNKWLMPFLRWQIFIISFVAILGISNAFALKFNNSISNDYCDIQEVIERLDKINDLKKIASISNDALANQISFTNSLIKLNLFISLFVTIYLALNILFYLKLRSHLKDHSARNNSAA